MCKLCLSFLSFLPATSDTVAMIMYDVNMSTTYMYAPGCHKERAAEERTGGPECTSGWDCAGRCAPLPLGGTYSPSANKWKTIVTIMSTHTQKITHVHLPLICLQPTCKQVSEWVIEYVCLSARGDQGRFDQGHNSALATFKAVRRSSDDPANHTSMTERLYVIDWCQWV